MLALVGAAALVAYLCILAVKSGLSLAYAARHREGDLGEGSLTVMQPILSGDPFLVQALRHNLEQTPAWARFLWLIDADDAEAARLTAPLAAEFGERVRIEVCPPVRGNVNPKSVKLQHGLQSVETDYVAVLDDDTILADHNLPKAIVALQTCTLYTGLPCYLPGPTFWSALVAHFVNNNSILTYLPLQPLVGPLTINGMFYVMRTQALKELGGFAPLLPQLCDDLALARLVQAHGGTIHQSVTPQLLHTTVTSAAHYVALMHRWFVFANVLVRHQRPLALVLLFVLLGLPPLLLWLGILCLFGGIGLAWLLPATLLVRHLVLRGLQRTILGSRPHCHPVMSVLAELLQPLHWLHACVQRTLRWRTRHIRLGRDGSFTYLPE